VIRFLLDMGLAQSTGRYLRSQGHDVIHLCDQWVPPIRSPVSSR